MKKNHGRSVFVSMLSIVPFAIISSAFAAQPINLSQQQGFNFLGSDIQVKEMRRSTDFNQTTHIHFQQTYAGYPVWGGEGVAHINTSDASLSAANAPGNTMNGWVFSGLQNDLKTTPVSNLSADQSQKAIAAAIQLYTQDAKLAADLQNKQSQLIVFLDKQHVAHYAYLVKFELPLSEAHPMPAQPHFILDAVTFRPYEQWDNVQTIEAANGGGYGGNEKSGKVIYDGAEKHLAALQVDRKGDVCSMKNKDVTVRNLKTLGMTMTYSCPAPSKKHNNVFWDGARDQINGGYSPSNDALFAGNVIKDLYKKWYKLSVLEQNGAPMMLTMLVHVPIENAFWNGYLMAFGDGGDMLYPLTSLGVGAHEVSHGFTQQHSNLAYENQSGGLNESFSDMAAQAAEVFAYGHNTWEIGPEIFKEKGRAIRYMKHPAQDCKGKKEGEDCSIENAQQYKDKLNVHYSSGVFNRAFYLIATSKGWTVRKAFDIMVKANMDYWTSTTSFQDAACGVVSATKDYKYDVAAVAAALKKVGLDTSQC